MTVETQETSLPNGPGAAAILATALGAFTLGLLSLLGDISPAIKKAMIFYKPTGALSGVTTIAVLVWLGAWGLLDWRWRRKTLPLARINFAAFVLLAASLLLTFPPFADLL